MRSNILPVYWLVGVVAAALLGFLPNHYAHRDPTLHVYATDTVLVVCALMTLQAGLLFAIYRPASYAASWGRALTALAVSFAFLILAALGSMHSPSAWGALSLWTLVLFLAAFALTCASALSAHRKR